MRLRFLPILLSVCMLFEQTALFAQQYLPYGQKAPVQTLQAPADNTALAIENAVKKQIAQASSSLLQARRLDSQARQSLKKQDLEAFYQQEKQLNALLISQLQSPLLDSRIFALEMLLAHVQEGLILQQDAQQAFLTVERQLQTQQKCQGKECQALGLSALLLSGSLFAHRPLVLPQDEEISLPQGRHQRLTEFYFSLLQRDYGSVESNNIIAPYLLRALGYAGGAEALRRAEDFLIEQSKRISVLWGAASIPGRNWYLNRYDVANLPAQKAAMQVLASLGEEGKKVLQYYAEQNRGLAAFTHANIELAYLGKSTVPVQENLQRLYCEQSWQLKSDADFELKKQIAYAYGHGFAPAYVYPSQEAHKCRVVVPQQPDPRLKNAELTQRIMGEILFIGGGEFLAILAQAQKVRLALQALKGKIGRQVSRVSAKLTPKPFAQRPVAVATATEEGVFAAARTAPAVRTTAQYLEEDKIILLNRMEDMQQTAVLSSGQQNHLKYLQGKLNTQPVTVQSLNEVKKDFSAIPHKKYNAFAVFGDEMETYEYVVGEMGNNFMARGVGFPANGRAPVKKVTRETIKDEFLQYGKMSDEIFVRWNMHGNLQNEVWRSYLSEDIYMDMPEVISIFQDIIRAGSTKTVTLYIDSCFPGAAFKEFMKLPEHLKSNINFFAPGGWRELRYYLPQNKPFLNDTPLGYAKQLWKSTLSTNSLAGKAYVNGNIYSPLRQAIMDTHLEGRRMYSTQLQGLFDLSTASSNDTFFDIVDNLKDLGLPIFQKGEERAIYMFLPRADMLIEHKGAYQIVVPEHLVYQVSSAFDKLPF